MVTKTEKLAAYQVSTGEVRGILERNVWAEGRVRSSMVADKLMERYLV